LNGFLHPRSSQPSLNKHKLDWAPARAGGRHRYWRGAVVVVVHKNPDYGMAPRRHDSAGTSNRCPAARRTSCQGITCRGALKVLPAWSLNVVRFRAGLTRTMSVVLDWPAPDRDKRRAFAPDGHVESKQGPSFKPFSVATFVISSRLCRCGVLIDFRLRKLAERTVRILFLFQSSLD
jgi:hypothetical protein